VSKRDLNKLSRSASPIWVLALCCVPVAFLAWQTFADQLGPDPAKYLMQSTGEWGLRGLVLVLLASPLSQRGYRFILRHRRILGVATFGYLTVHFLLFAQVYVGWSGDLLREELRERPYVLVGFAAWLCLAPLAATSTNAAMRLMGRSWWSLHRLVYLAVMLAWLHIFWLARSDVGKAVFYGLVYAALLAWRLGRLRRRGGRGRAA